MLLSCLSDAIGFVCSVGYGVDGTIFRRPAGFRVGEVRHFLKLSTWGLKQVLLPLM